MGEDILDKLSEEQMRRLAREGMESLNKKLDEALSSLKFCYTNTTEENSLARGHARLGYLLARNNGKKCGLDTSIKDDIYFHLTGDHVEAEA